MNRWASNRSRAGLNTYDSWWRSANDDNQPEGVRSVESWLVTGNSLVRSASYEKTRRARNQATHGSSVGGYLETIRTLRQVVLARSGVTKQSTDDYVRLYSMAGTGIWGETRKEN
jgi:hypothetical protein